MTLRMTLPLRRKYLVWSERWRLKTLAPSSKVSLMTHQEDGEYPRIDNGR